MSSTSMAARVSDEVAEFDEENTRAAKGSPLISLPPPPPFRDAHFHVSIIRNLSVNYYWILTCVLKSVVLCVQGDEEEAKVDVNEQRKADDVDSV